MSDGDNKTLASIASKGWMNGLKELIRKIPTEQAIYFGCLFIFLMLVIDLLATGRTGSEFYTTIGISALFIFLVLGIVRTTITPSGASPHLATDKQVKETVIRKVLEGL